MYTTTSSLTSSYNAGAIAGTAYLIQLVSGILMAMLYLSSEYTAYETLDLLLHGVPLDIRSDILCNEIMLLVLICIPYLDPLPYLLSAVACYHPQPADPKYVYP